MMEISSTTWLRTKRFKQPLVHFGEDATMEVMQRIRSHVETLSIIRMDQNFRLVYLFQGKVHFWLCQPGFSECHARMLQFLDDMEASAILLDRMKGGSKISSVAGSSVGAVGGDPPNPLLVWALAPVTAGLSSWVWTEDWGGVRQLAGNIEHNWAKGENLLKMQDRQQPKYLLPLSKTDRAGIHHISMLYHGLDIFNSSAKEGISLATGDTSENSLRNQEPGSTFALRGSTHGTGCMSP
ncbi:hypothetical protein N1851_021343 [Merluccius polli]|uniref:Uncharacterized protein n=1 Tax=Merluccius polli TaxID=89951 RepID=A0AA47NYI0_MERPO|nr:hypothetical protein N1851_021343 [Merluccius polli]